MSDPIVVRERRAVDWTSEDVAYTYDDLLSLYGEDDGSTVRPLVLRCMALERQRDEAMALLRSLEWTTPDAHFRYPACPACHAMQQWGHAPDCRLAAFLRGQP